VDVIQEYEPQELVPFIETLLTCLEDCDPMGAHGSIVVLNVTIRKHGTRLEKECGQLVKKMIEKMNLLSKQEPIVTGLLHSIRNMCRLFPTITHNTLLNYSTQPCMEVIRAWQHVCLDKSLVEQTLDYLIDVMNNAQQYEEKRESNGTITLIGTNPPKQSTIGLSSVFTLNEMSHYAKKYYARVLIGGLLRLGSCISVNENNAPIKDVESLLRNLFIIVCKSSSGSSSLGDDSGEKINGFENESQEVEGEDEEEDNELVYDDKRVYGDMKDVWGLMNKDQYGEFVQSTLEITCKAHIDLIKEMYTITSPFVNRPLIGIRVCATSICATLLSHIHNDRELVHAVINSLLSRSGTDEKVIVKLYSLRGLSNLTKQSKDVLHKYVTPVTGALIANLEDTDESIILETMKSVKIVFGVADDEYISPLLLNLCVRLKPAFEKSNPLIRENSILLFGQLARFAKGSLSDTLILNFFNNLPTIVLHLQDNDANVIRACKICLKDIVPQLGGKKMVALFDTESFHTVDDVVVDKKDGKKSADLSTELLDFDVFAEQFAKVFIEEFSNRISDLVMNLVVFYKSDWAGVCAGAVLIIGHLLANINEEMRGRVNLRHTCAGLVSLLRHSNPLIREKASKVMGMLYEA